MSINAFIHAANILLLLAYSVTDVLWLRLFAVASSAIAIPYFLLQPSPQWAPVGWSVLFAGINLFQSTRLFMERRPVKLTPEEERVRTLAFADLSPRKLLEILSLGSWNTAEPGQRLIERGRPVDAVALIVRGRVHVTKEGRLLGELRAGDLVGSAVLLTAYVAAVDATAAEPVRHVRWPIATLKRYLEANPDARIVLQRHLAHDLAGKLNQVTA